MKSAPVLPPTSGRAAQPGRPRNDVGQYDDLVGEWWKQEGQFAALHWLARARSQLIPPSPTRRALLVDVGCGGGILAAHMQGYVHIGVDVCWSALRVAAEKGVLVVRGDAGSLPLPTGVADVVVAGEVFEHVTHLEAAVAEVSRVLRPGGIVVVDTINDTRLARLTLVTLGERVPGGPPRRIHDPDLFVPPARLTELFAQHGLELRVRGLRPSAVDYLRFLVRRRGEVRMLPTPRLSGLYQGVGRKVER